MIYTHPFADYFAKAYVATDKEDHTNVEFINILHYPYGKVSNRPLISRAKLYYNVRISESDSYSVSIVERIRASRSLKDYQLTRINRPSAAALIYNQTDAWNDYLNIVKYVIKWENFERDRYGLIYRDGNSIRLRYVSLDNVANYLLNIYARYLLMFTSVSGGSNFYIDPSTLLLDYPVTQSNIYTIISACHFTELNRYDSDVLRSVKNIVNCISVLIEQFSIFYSERFLFANGK